MIGQLCTCDVGNYGDLLYPVISRKMAEKHGVTAAITPLSFFQGPAPCDSGYVVQGINEVLPAAATGLSHLVIGGGDILRTDVDTLATHYYSIYEKRAGNHFSQRLKKILLGRKHLRKKFIRQFMGYSPIAPFILDAANCAQTGPIIYCSCGVPFRFPPEKSPAIRAAFEAAALVYLRDDQSRDKLREIGVQRDIEVAPDLIVTLGDFFDKDAERAKGLAILAGCGVDTAKDIVCFQSVPQSPKKEHELLQQLTALKRKTDAEIVLLPIGYCHGDDVFLRQLAEKSGGLLTYIPATSIFAMLSVIAASRLFVGTSMHGNITAFSFGIPHLFGPIAVDKAEGFLAIAGLDAGLKMAAWSQLADKQAMIASLPPDYFSTRATAAKQAVNATFAKIAGILKNPAPQKTPLK